MKSYRATFRNVNSVSLSGRKGFERVDPERGNKEMALAVADAYYVIYYRGKCHTNRGLSPFGVSDAVSAGKELNRMGQRNCVAIDMQNVCLGHIDRVGRVGIPIAGIVARWSVEGRTVERQHRNGVIYIREDHRQVRELRRSVRRDQVPPLRKGDLVFAICGLRFGKPKGPKKYQQIYKY